MNITIDRFEEDMAVCLAEDGTKIDLPKKLFPGASEGDVYSLTLSPLPEEREKRHKSIEEKAKRLWAD